MRKSSKKLLVPINCSNKLLLHQVKTQLLKVINYYCLQGMLQLSRKFFLFFLNTIAGASTKSQAQAETQSQAQAKAQEAVRQLPGTHKLRRNNLLRIEAACPAYLVIKYDPFFLDWDSCRTIDYPIERIEYAISY